MIHLTANKSVICPANFLGTKQMKGSHAISFDTALKAMCRHAIDNNWARGSGNGYDAFTHFNEREFTRITGFTAPELEGMTGWAFLDEPGGREGVIRIYHNMSNPKWCFKQMWDGTIKLSWA